MRIIFYRTGNKATEISARSLHVGGAMAMFFGKIDVNNIHLMGRWHSDAMMQYRHGQDQPIVGRFAEVMYNNGAYTFQPEETVPILDSKGYLLPIFKKSPPPPTIVCSGTWGQYQVRAAPLARFARNA
jgi:hypothetical protein